MLIFIYLPLIQRYCCKLYQGVQKFCQNTGPVPVVTFDMTQHPLEATGKCFVFINCQKANFVIYHIRLNDKRLSCQVTFVSHMIQERKVEISDWKPSTRQILI